MNECIANLTDAMLSTCTEPQFSVTGDGHISVTRKGRVASVNVFVGEAREVDLLELVAHAPRVNTMQHLLRITYHTKNTMMRCRLDSFRKRFRRVPIAVPSRQLTSMPHLIDALSAARVFFDLGLRAEFRAKRVRMDARSVQWAITVHLRARCRIDAVVECLRVFVRRSKFVVQGVGLVVQRGVIECRVRESL